MTDSANRLAARIAFASYRNISIGTARKFASLNIGPDEFFNLDSPTLAALTGMKPDFFDDSRRRAALESARREADAVLAAAITPLFYTDPAFPARLLDCDDAPAMLFACGSPEFGFRHSIAIVGTRHATAYGADFTKRFISELADRIDGLLVVSGLAYGIDICAHRAALDSGVATGAVLAHGLNSIYPAEHRADAARIARNGGFLITEYRTDSHIHRGNFLARNRIVAALADATIVVESDIRGGAMSTARIAAAYDRDVFAVPGRVGDPYSRGTNELIASRAATILRSPADLIDVMGWTARLPEGTQQTIEFDLQPDHARIIDHIRRFPAATVNDMCVALGIPYQQLSSILFEMEIDDLIITLPGGRFALPAKNN